MNVLKLAVDVLAILKSLIPKTSPRKKNDMVKFANNVPVYSDKAAHDMPCHMNLHCFSSTFDS